MKVSRRVAYGATVAMLIFGMPWGHWLAYHNLLIAWPNMDHEQAHWIAGGGAACISFFTAMFFFG